MKNKTTLVLILLTTIVLIAAPQVVTYGQIGDNGLFWLGLVIAPALIVYQSAAGRDDSESN
jgi:4-hydroxybenzoate polyprenyltransferase